MYDFLDERARDARYLEKLGLISVIRRDFEELGSLLRDWSTHGAGDGTNEPSPPGSSAVSHPIGRIILYIDDLDRCPPQRVVEVLQAVHLLLAFDLFVVVVAVDARWLQRSLNEAYNSRPASQNDPAGQEPVHRFNAHNYLEKIFQIPFSVPAMEQAGFQKLITNMSGTPRERAERRARLAAGGSPPEIPTTPEPSRPEGGGSVDPSPAPLVEAQTRGIDDKVPTPDEEASKRAEAEQRQKHEQEEAKKRIAAMLLHDYEEQFVKALFPFIATPRLAKRFINIYRLFRVRAATQNEHFARFIDRDTGEYRAVLVLLAISIGHAETAAEIFDDIVLSKEENFQSWLKSSSRDIEEKRDRLSKEPNGPNVPGARAKRLENLQTAAETIGSQMVKVETELDRLGAPGVDKELKNYAAWAREVGRYSFGWRMD